MKPPSFTIVTKGAGSNWRGTTDLPENFARRMNWRKRPFSPMIFFANLST